MVALITKTNGRTMKLKRAPHLRQTHIKRFSQLDAMNMCFYKKEDDNWSKYMRQFGAASQQ